MIDEKQVKKYCIEDISLIENYYEAITSNEKWDCHHRLEIQDDKVMTVDELKKAGLYYNRSASELTFMKHTEHVSLHKKGDKNPFYENRLINPMFGKHHSKETKRRLSEANKGEKNPMYGKRLSEETKQKIREALQRRKSMEVNEQNSLF